MSLFRKPRFFWVYPLAVWVFLTANTTEGSLRLGVLVALAGEALRMWANGYVGHRKVNVTQKWRGDAKIGRLITAGPYAHVRNPLYVGTWLIGAGVCLAVRSLAAALGALAVFWWLYGRKVHQEEQLILDEVGQDYEAYCQTVPRWIPSLRRAAHQSGQQWSWQGIWASKELKTFLWVIVVFLALYFREEYLQEHELFSAEHRWKHFFLLIALVGLMAGDGIMELRKRWERRQPVNDP